MTQIPWQYQVNNRAGGYIVTNTDWNDVAGDLRALIDQTTSSTTDNTPLPIGIDLANDRVYISDPDSTTPEDGNHADTTLSVVGTTTLAGDVTISGADLTVGGGDLNIGSTTGGETNNIAGVTTTSGAGSNLKMKSGDATGTNQSGSWLILQPGLGTGTGASGDILFYTGPAGSSGTSQNTATKAMTITSAQNVEMEEDLSVSGTITQNSVIGRVSPSGSIVGFGGASAPTGWLLCDGSAVSRTTYSDLFSAISTAYGVGDGSSTFNVPNLKGKVPVGLDAADGSFDALAETGGASTVTLATSDIPSHNHTQDAHGHTQDAHGHTQNAHGHTQNAHTHTQNSHTHNLNSPVDGGLIGSTIGGFGSYYTRMNIGDSTNLLWIATGTTATNQNTTATNQNTTATNQNTTATNQTTTATNQTTGGGGSHANLQPYVVINYIIAI